MRQVSEDELPQSDKITVPKDVPGATNQADTDAKQSAEISRIDRRVERREHLTLLVAIVGVVIAAGSVVVSERQRQIMQRQLDDSGQAAVETSKTTDRQLKIAESQAESMRLLAESTRSNERARLYVQNAFLSTSGMLPNVGERFKATVEIGNSGRSAAKHVSSNIVLDLLPPGRIPVVSTLPFHGDYAVPPNTGGVGVEMSFELMQNGRILGPLSATVQRSITVGRAVPLLYGRVNYQDVFGDPHWLRICRVWKHNELNSYTGGRGGWRDCTGGEPTDDDRPLTSR